jgi:hypothetical protein
MATEGGRISPPSHCGGSRPPQWSDLSFFFFFGFAGNVAEGGRLAAALLAGGGRWIFLVA